jgi:hypothetical protein
LLRARQIVHRVDRGARPGKKGSVAMRRSTSARASDRASSAWRSVRPSVRNVGRGTRLEIGMTKGEHRLAGRARPAGRLRPPGARREAPEQRRAALVLPTRPDHGRGRRVRRGRIGRMTGGGPAPRPGRAAWLGS